MTREQHIQVILSANFAPVFFQIENESHKHRAELGMESHFKLILVSQAFQGMGLVTRHRAVTALLKEEFAHGLHALSLHLFTVEEWEARGQAVPRSPACRNS